METNSQLYTSFWLDFSISMEHVTIRVYSFNLNYNEIATVDDGSCEYPTDLGNLECGASLYAVIIFIMGPI